MVLPLLTGLLITMHSFSLDAIITLVVILYLFFFAYSFISILSVVKSNYFLLESNVITCTFSMLFVPSFDVFVYISILFSSSSVFLSPTSSPTVHGIAFFSLMIHFKYLGNMSTFFAFTHTFPVFYLLHKF